MSSISEKLLGWKQAVLSLGNVKLWWALKIPSTVPRDWKEPNPRARGWLKKRPEKHSSRNRANWLVCWISEHQLQLIIWQLWISSPLKSNPLPIFIMYKTEVTNSTNAQFLFVSASFWKAALLRWRSWEKEAVLAEMVLKWHVWSSLLEAQHWLWATLRGTKYLLQAQHKRDTQNSVFEVNTVLMEFLTGQISTKKQQDERTARALSKDGIMKNSMLSCLGAGSRKQSGNTHFALFKILVYYLFTRLFICWWF